MKTLLKLLSVCFYCACVFAENDVERVAQAFDNMIVNRSNELTVTDVDLNNPKVIRCFFARLASLGEEICIKLVQCRCGIIFLREFFGKHYKVLYLYGNDSMDPGTVGVCLNLLGRNVFSELHIGLVNYRMAPCEMICLNRVLENNRPLKTLYLNGDCCTPADFKMITEKLVGNTQLTTFVVENEKFDDDCLNDLTTLLDEHRPQIEYLCFRGGNLGRESLAKFAVALPPTLKTLWFGYESADTDGIRIFVNQVAKRRQLDFFPVGPNFEELRMAYQIELQRMQEKSLAVAPLPSVESCEASIVPEMEKSLEPAHKKMRVGEVDEATDDDSAVYGFYYSRRRKGEHNTILEELKKFKEGKKIGTLSLNECRIGEDFIKELLVLPVLRTVEELWLNGNPIGDAGATEIAGWLSDNKTLKKLYLKGYGAGQFCTGKKGVKRILEAMEKSKLRFIDMRGNAFPGSETCIWNEDSGISRSEFVKKQLEALLDEAMDEDSEVSKFCRKGVRREKRDSILDELKEFGKTGKTIDKLSLNQCCIGEDFIKRLLALPVLRTVEELWLNGNPIGDAGAICIAQWLEGNDTVEELHLRGYRAQVCTGKNGARRILEAMEKSKLRFIDMRGNDFPGSETCIWFEGIGKSREEFIEDHLKVLSVVEVDEAIDKDEENPEDKTSGNVDVTENPNRTSQESSFEDDYGSESGCGQSVFYREEEEFYY